MEKLKTEIKTIIELDAFDLEKFINKIYEIDFELFASEEWANDTSYTFRVRKEPLGKYDIEKLSKVMNGKFEHCMIRTFLQDLVNKDHISEGEYLIKVSW